MPLQPTLIAHATLLAALTAGAHGAIVSATPGTIVRTTPQFLVTSGAFGPQFAHTWNERQALPVSGIAVDNVGNTGNSTNNATPGLITGVVDVHMIHKEPHWPLGSGSLQGTVTFDKPVVGVMWTAASLIASDALCAAGTSYGTSPSRGIDVGVEWVVVSGSTVSFDLTHGNFPHATYSEIRVLTAVPTPGATGLLVAGGVLALARRRRRLPRPARSTLPT